MGQRTVFESGPPGLRSGLGQQSCPVPCASTMGAGPGGGGRGGARGDPAPAPPSPAPPLRSARPPLPGRRLSPPSAPQPGRGAESRVRRRGRQRRRGGRWGRSRGGDPPGIAREKEGVAGGGEERRSRTGEGVPGPRPSPPRRGGRADHDARPAGAARPPAWRPPPVAGLPRRTAGARNVLEWQVRRRAIQMVSQGRGKGMFIAPWASCFPLLCNREKGTGVRKPFLET
ncbi:translation initiation factor IF-2-like [Harpia harpyja]|uniref:translation initiation factor IF-2-like n=1 Tax=Harpia harpyja TaxID=202280 RepID=UPI0022B0F7F4|nr:translation initiation factor IF-2-like [Harpia harpyja]